MFITKLFTISCFLSTFATNLTKANHFLIKTKENVKRHDGYKDGGENKVDCVEVFCILVLNLSCIFCILVNFGF